MNALVLVAPLLAWRPPRTGYDGWATAHRRRRALHYEWRMTATGVPDQDNSPLQMDPRHLTQRIKHVQGVDDLLELHDVHGEAFNHIHLSACWTSLGRLSQCSADPYWHQEHAEVLEALVDHTMEMIAGDRSKIGPRELANICLLYTSPSPRD